MERFRKKRSRSDLAVKKMVIIVGAIFSAILVGVATNEINEARIEAYTEAQRDLTVISSILTQEFNGLIKIHGDVLVKFRENLLRREGGKAHVDLQRTLRELLSQSALDAAFIFDRDGHNLLAESEISQIQTPPAPKFLLGAPRRFFAFDGPEHSKSDFISISEPLYSSGPRARIRWLATTLVNVAGPINTAKALSSNGDYKVTLMTDDGRSLINYPSDVSLSSTELLSEATDAWRHGNNIAPLHIENRRHAASERMLTQIEGAPLVLRVAIDDSAVDVRWAKKSWIFIGLTLAGLSITWSLIFIVFRQIDRLIVASNRGRHEDEMFVSILSNLHDGIIISDKSGCIVFINTMAYQLIGAKPGINLIGDHAEKYLPASVKIMLKEFDFFGSFPPTASTTWEGKFPRCDSTYFDSEVSLSFAKIGSFNGAVITIHDTSAQKTHEQQLIYAATTDLVTNLPNHMSFVERLTDALQSHGVDVTIAVIALNISINQEGELDSGLLQLASDRILTVTREADFVAAEGGGNFLILACGVDEPVDLALIAKRVCGAFEIPLLCAGNAYTILPRVGIAFSPIDANGSLELIRAAKDAQLINDDEFLYHFFNKQVARQLSRLHDKTLSLKKSFEDGELKLTYTPVFNLDDEHARGILVDAYLPLHGEYISVERLIPLIEEGGFANVLDLSTWRKLVDDLSSTSTIDEDYIIFIHIQHSHLISPSFVDSANIELAMLKNVFQISFIISEIYSDDFSPTTADRIRSLRNFGYKFYLGDVGVGLTSLSQLASLEFDGVRVDRSIVTRLDQDEQFLFMTALVSTARSLHLNILASGADSKSIASVLEKMKVDYATGLYFGWHMSIEEVLQLLGQADNPLIHRTESKT